jgi:prepilin-type N-terminal cleavage/methylation domain-containing protein
MTTREHTEQKARLRGGFSLVEVSLAIFIVAVGLLTLFSLFPKGLQQGALAHADTQTALFADYVLSTLRGKSMSISLADWDDLLTDLGPSTGGTAPSTIWAGFFTLKSFADPDPVEFPEGSGLYVRYRLEFDELGDNYTVALWVQSGQYGSSDVGTFTGSSEAYYTELFFTGMP